MTSPDAGPHDAAPHHAGPHDAGPHDSAPHNAAPNAISPIRFIVGFGVVSASADMVYESARSIIGPYLASLGAGAAAIGLITGAGEAAALVLRLITGPLADRSHRPWLQTILGYALTAVSVPLLAVTGQLATAAVLYNAERTGKAVRTPARDSMLAHASARLGRGYAFGLHEALDQLGAIAGPLVVAAVLAAGGRFRLAFAILAVPGAVALLLLWRLRRRAPDPLAWEPTVEVAERKRLRLDKDLPPVFWQYAGFSATTMLGFSTWALLAFHLVHRHVVPTAAVPVLYAVAMAAASAAAVVFGRLYDRFGPAGLLTLPLLAAAVPALAFTTDPAAVIVGTVIWGAAMGVHESTMRAAVADFVPPGRRGAGFGTFTAFYGLAWLTGSVVLGWLYQRSVADAIWFVAVVQLVALGLLIRLLRAGRADRAARA